MAFLVTMGIIFCVVLFVLAIWRCICFSDWVSNTNETLECYRNRIKSLENYVDYLKRSNDGVRN